MQNWDKKSAKSYPNFNFFSYWDKTRIKRLKNRKKLSQFEDFFVLG